MTQNQIDFLLTCKEIQEKNGHFTVKEIEILTGKDRSTVHGTFNRHIKNEFIEQSGLTIAKEKAYVVTEVCNNILDAEIEYRKQKAFLLIEGIKKGDSQELIDLMKEIKEVEPVGIEKLCEYSKEDKASTVKNRLYKLVTAGLVNNSRKGKQVLCSLNHEKLASLEIGLS